MIVQLVATIAALMAGGYLAVRCFGPIRTVPDRVARRRQQAIEQAQVHYQRLEEYRRRKEVGLEVAPPPRMPLAVAILVNDPSAPWR